MGYMDGIVSGATGGSAAGPWGAVAGAAIGLFGSLFGAHMASSAATKSAQIQADAQLKAQQLQAKSAADALAFTKQQAQQTYLTDETNRRANYDQWAAREGRLGSVEDLLGYGPRNTPAYVAGVDPHFATAPAAPPPAGYVRPATLPTYAANTGSNGLTPPPLMGSVDSYLDPRNLITPDLQHRAAPGSVGSYMGY